MTVDQNSCIRDLTYESFTVTFLLLYFFSSISISARKIQNVTAQNIGTEILGLSSSQVILNFCYCQIYKNLKLYREVISNKEKSRTT